MSIIFFSNTGGKKEIELRNILKGQRLIRKRSQRLKYILDLAYFRNYTCVMMGIVVHGHLGPGIWMRYFRWEDWEQQHLQISEHTLMPRALPLHPSSWQSFHSSTKSKPLSSPVYCSVLCPTPEASLSPSHHKCTQSWRLRNDFINRKQWKETTRTLSKEVWMLLRCLGSEPS